MFCVCALHVVHTHSKKIFPSPQLAVLGLLGAKNAEDGDFPVHRFPLFAQVGVKLAHFRAYGSELGLHTLGCKVGAKIACFTFWGYEWAYWSGSLARHRVQIAER